MACYHPLSSASHTHTGSLQSLGSCCIFQIQDEIRYWGLIAQYLYIFHVGKWKQSPVGSHPATRWLCDVSGTSENKLELGLCGTVCSGVTVFFPKYPVFNTPTVSTRHGIAFLGRCCSAQNRGRLWLHPGGVADGPVLCCPQLPPGPGLRVCRVFPAMGMTLWTFLKWIQMHLGCRRLQLTEYKIIKVLRLDYCSDIKSLSRTNWHHLLPENGT